MIQPGRKKVKYQFPPKLRFLFSPHRYKVARGGRGSGKSWSYARALLLTGARTPLRILCTREVQKSIKDSVIRLLSDQVKDLGLSGFYRVMEYEIRGANGTAFLFSGLSDQTADSIKSFEGIDRVWIEEAHNVSKRSWDILIPTIRKPGSEIWVTFNPELDSDETYKRFVVNPPPDCVSVLVNFRDNPWFPPVLEKERLHCQLTDPANYPNIWEGATKPAVEGAIYYDEMVNAEAGGQICRLPYDPDLKVHIVMDLGWNDAMAIALVQRLRSEIRIIEYLEESHKTLDWISATLKAKRLNWGKMFLPHDGLHGDFKTGKSAAQIMEGLGWEVAITPGMSIEAGIQQARRSFGRFYFDSNRTSRLVECLKRYRRRINKQTNEAGEPLHDEYSHGADVLRYIAINAEKMTNEEWSDDDYRQNSSTGRDRFGGY